VISFHFLGISGRVQERLALLRGERLNLIVRHAGRLDVLQWIVVQ
jgi:hypothetical protein